MLTGFPTAAEQALKGAPPQLCAWSGTGQRNFSIALRADVDRRRTVLLTRWRTGGRTNLDLVREFVRELPNLSAAEAWQRSVLLARETQLDAGQEPRLKRPDEAAEPPKATHPFFWAGYLLVDNSPPASEDKAPSDKPVDKAPDLPPPTRLKMDSTPPTGTPAPRIPPQSN